MCLLTSNASSQMIWFHKANLTKINFSHCGYLCWKTNLVQGRLTVRLNRAPLTLTIGMQYYHWLTYQPCSHSLWFYNSSTFYIAKILERIVASQLHTHLIDNNLSEPLCTFFLWSYRHILLCSYEIASGMYCGGLEFKYSGTVAIN